MRTPLITFLLLLIISSVLWARDPREEKRIEHLLQTVESLKGAAFIRNGTEYNAKDAGKHLRMKLAKAGDRVKTAEDFIEGCASRSSFSGERTRFDCQMERSPRRLHFFEPSFESLTMPASKSPNHAMERTATRCAFAFSMTKTFSPRATIAPGGRRSSNSR